MASFLEGKRTFNLPFRIIEKLQTREDGNGWVGFEHWDLDLDFRACPL